MQVHLAQHSLSPPSTSKVPKHRHTDDSRSFESEAQSKPNMQPNMQGTSKKGGSKGETQNVHPDEGSMELGAPATAQLSLLANASMKWPDQLQIEEFEPMGAMKYRLMPSRQISRHLANLESTTY